VRSIAIIGIGSPYGADQAGWRLVETLKRELDLHSCTNGSLNFIKCDHPGLMLLDMLSGLDYAILIDAVEGGQKGNIIQVDKQGILENSRLSTHSLGVKEVLLLGSRLDSLPQDFDLIGVEVGDVLEPYPLNSQTLIKIKKHVLRCIQTYLTSR
jgi:hydrogenase maturation protease